jgi:DNA modification methylase
VKKPKTKRIAITVYVNIPEEMTIGETDNWVEGCFPRSARAMCGDQRAIGPLRELPRLRGLEAHTMRNVILTGDALTTLRKLEPESVQCCVTSPPYWGLRNYGIPGQLGAEKTPAEYIAKLVAIFGEVRRVLRADGTCWLNLGDTLINAKGRAHGVDPKQSARRFGLRPNDVSVPGYKRKDIAGIPWRTAFALQDDGWYLRSDIVWNKPNAMPESVKDRPTRAHEYVFLLAKSLRYFYDEKAIEEPATRGYAGSTFTKGKTAAAGLGRVSQLPRIEKATRHARSVWTIPTQPYKGAHFAVFPPELPRRCILAASRPGDVVLDPFAGSGTTLAVARQLGRDYIGVELNSEYRPLADGRIKLAEMSDDECDPEYKPFGKD